MAKFLMTTSIFMICWSLQAQTITISGSNNIVILSSRNISIDQKVTTVGKENLRALAVQGLPKKLLTFKGTRSEKTDPKDPRILDVHFAYSDRREQVSQVKEWLGNPYSGYPRLLELCQSFFTRNTAKIQFSGNILPLTTVNEKLLKILERGTDEPLKPDEEVPEATIANAVIQAWYEKNSN